MITPKSPNEILKEFNETDPDDFWHEWGETWFRSSMASLLMWASEIMPKTPNSVFAGLAYAHDEELAKLREEGIKRGYQLATDDCKAALIEEAKKIIE